MRLPIARRSALDARVRELEETRNERNQLARDVAAHAEARALAETSLAALEGDRNRLSIALARARAELERDALIRAPLEAALAQANARYEELEKTYGALTVTHMHASNRLEALELEVARLGAETMRLEAEKGQINADLESLRTELTRISRRQHSSAAVTGKRYFIAFSLGRTATQWLVTVLNAHPDILATHAMDIGPEKRDPASKGSAFLESLQRQQSIQAAINGVDSAFDLMESAPQKVIGNVHGIDGLQVFESPTSFKRDYYVSYIIRHPILRLRSLVDRWQYEIDLDEARRQIMRDAFSVSIESLPASIRSKASSLSEDEDWLFAHAVNYLLTAERRYLQSAAPRILYERLVTDADYLLWYLRQLSGGAIAFPPAFIENALAQSPVDARGKASPSAREAYLGWPQWRRDLFRTVLEVQKTQDLYSDLGYDTKF